VHSSTQEASCSIAFTALLLLGCTIHAVILQALKPIEKFANMMLSNPSTATDMLGLFVVPGAPLKLSDLKDGMKLTTLNNQQVTVNIKQ
jgi:hypothetical protein